MKIKILFLIISGIISNSFAWNIDSWRIKEKSVYLPTYSNTKNLLEVEDKLKSCAPIVTGNECLELKRKLAKVGSGKAFLLIGGDCAESFDSSTNYHRDMYRLLLKMGLFLSYSNGLPTIKIARMGGQYAKPRSQPFELLENGTKIESYRGDIINDISIENRDPDPYRMLIAYQKSVEIVNLLRSFSFGGYASVHNIDHWNLDDILKNVNSSYETKIKDSIRFMKGLDLNTKNPIFTQTKIYLGHESLLLNYEESLTRYDSMLHQNYSCSGHFLWLGERTRDLDSPHLEYLKGVENPIGIKISEKIKEDEFVTLFRKLNPDNENGKITIITRYGKDKIKKNLPNMIKIVKKNNLSVVWCCDPMHGNIRFFKRKKLKTRIYRDILEETISFFHIHQKYGTIPGGIHLEMTPDMVTECIDYESIREKNLDENYKTKCDPRLNAKQSISLISSLSDFFIEN